MKAGQRILIREILHSSFLNEIKPFAPSFEEKKPASDLDLVFFGAEAKDSLKQIVAIAQIYREKWRNLGGLSEREATHTREIDVIAAGKSAGAYISSNQDKLHRLTLGAGIDHSRQNFVTGRRFLKSREVKDGPRQAIKKQAESGHGASRQPAADGRPLPSAELLSLDSLPG